MGKEYSQSKWEPKNNPEARPYHFHRCFEERLRSSLQQSADQREMVCCRETLTYKCSRTEWCLSRNPITFKKSTSQDSFIEHGQLYSSCLRQSQRGNTLFRTRRSDTSTLGLVHSERSVHNSTSCTGKTEYFGGPRVQGISRRDRLDDRSENHPTFPDQLRHGSLCHSAYTAADDLHQLETRPPRSPLRRFQFELEKPGGIRLPSFQLNSISSEQGCIRQGGDHSSGSNMASAALVVPPSQSTSTTTCPPPEQGTPTDKPSRSPSGSPNAPTSPLGRISYLQQRYQTEGLSTQVASLLIAATRSSTCKTYESSWRHPYVVKLMKGILNNRPPKPRYSYTWDVHLVTEHMKKMGDNSSLSLKQLSLKLATLFAITCPKRVSSLSSLDLHHYKLLPEGLVFTLTVATKTTRPDETVEAFFTRFPEDSKLCPVECLNTYLSSTSRLRNLSEAEKSNNLFVSYIKPHQPVTTASVARWIRAFLTEAGIDTSVFKTHSIRGGSYFGSCKCIRASPRNLKDGRLVQCVYFSTILL